MAEIVRAPDLIDELTHRGRPVRVQVRAAYPPWALDPGLRAASARVRDLGVARADWRRAGHVGEVVVDAGDVGVEAVVDAVADGLVEGGITACHLVPGVEVPRGESPVVIKGLGPSRAVNGLAEAVASTYDRSGDPVASRRVREAAASAVAGEEHEVVRRQRVLGLVLRTWLPAELDAAGATAEAAEIRALPNPTSDADRVLDLVGRAILSAVARLEGTPRAVVDLESAYAAGRDLHDVTWGCAGVGGRAGEAVVAEARSGRSVRRPPGQVLYQAAATAAVGGLFDEVADVGEAALARWRRLAQDDRAFHRLVDRILRGQSAEERLAAVDAALRGGVVAAASETQKAVLLRELDAVPAVAWSLALCTGWEAAGERCRHVIARRAAAGEAVATARDVATAAVLEHLRPLADAGAALVTDLQSGSPI